MRIDRGVLLAEVSKSFEVLFFESRSSEIQRHSAIVAFDFNVKNAFLSISAIASMPPLLTKRLRASCASGPFINTRKASTMDTLHQFGYLPKQI